MAEITRRDLIKMVGLTLTCSLLKVKPEQLRTERQLSRPAGFKVRGKINFGDLVGIDADGYLVALNAGWALTPVGIAMTGGKLIQKGTIRAG